jgi:hypothetical protein
VGVSPTFFFVHELKVFQDGTGLPGWVCNTCPGKVYPQQCDRICQKKIESFLVLHLEL